jgi:hypothetical protein
MRGNKVYDRASDALPVEVRLYDRLFKVEHLDTFGSADGKDY